MEFPENVRSVSGLKRTAATGRSNFFFKRWLISSRTSVPPALSPANTIWLDFVPVDKIA